MIRVKFTQDHGTYREGQFLTVSEADAKNLVDRGLVEKAPVPEAKAAKVPRNKAAKAPENRAATPDDTADTTVVDGVVLPPE